MSQFHRHKPKPLKTNRAVFAAGEGVTEEVFLKFLKELFRGQYDDINIRMHDLSGGSHDIMLKKRVTEWRNRIRRLLFC